MSRCDWGSVPGESPTTETTEGTGRVGRKDIDEGNRLFGRDWCDKHFSGVVRQRGVEQIKKVCRKEYGTVLCVK